MARRVAFLVLFAAFAAHVVLTVAGLPGTDVARTAVELVSLGLVSARAIAVERNRGAWGLVAASVVLWMVGDIAYVGTFGALYLALGALLRDRIRPFPAWLTIDGLLAGLTLIALASAAFDHAPAIALARLVGVLLLLLVVLVGFTASGWRPGRSWWLLGAALLDCATGDACSARGTPLESVWLFTLVCFAAAAWQRTAAPTRAHVGWAMGALPVGFAGVAIVTMLTASLL